jgi:hypothetical protein
MIEKIDEALLKKIDEAEKINPKEEIPVILTLSSDADHIVLEQKGLKIHRSFVNISAVSGTLTASQAKDIARLAEVERIEYDGTVRAL